MASRRANDRRAEPRHPQRLLTKIEASLGSLSPNDRRLADHLLGAYPTAAWETVEEVAHQVGVSKSAVVRFANRLGYDGFAELQRELQDELTELLASPLRLMELRAPTPDTKFLDEMLDRAIENLRRTRHRVSWSQILDVAKRITDCEGRVYVIGFRKSAGLAEYLHHMLRLVISNVVHVRPDSASLPEVLLDVTSEDFVLALTVRRYTRATLAAIEHCHDAGAHVVTISDTLAGPATPRSDTVLVAQSEGLSLFDTSLSVVFVLEAVVNAVASKNDGAVGRLQAAEMLGRQFGIFEAATHTPPRHTGRSRPG